MPSAFNFPYSETASRYVYFTIPSKCRHFLCKYRYCYCIMKYSIKKKEFIAQKRRADGFCHVTRSRMLYIMLGRYSVPEGHK
jgi:hypothetical protein